MPAARSIATKSVDLGLQKPRLADNTWDADSWSAVEAVDRDGAAHQGVLCVRVNWVQAALFGCVDSVDSRLSCERTAWELGSNKVCMLPAKRHFAAHSGGYVNTSAHQSLKRSQTGCGLVHSDSTLLLSALEMCTPGLPLPRQL